jgi:hypothetical protein
MRKIILVLLAFSLVLCTETSHAQKSREFYQITVYHFNTADQEKAIDSYLKNAYMPALHRRGIKNGRL